MTKPVRHTAHEIKNAAEKTKKGNSTKGDAITIISLTNGKRLKRRPKMDLLDWKIWHSEQPGGLPLSPEDAAKAEIRKTRLRGVYFVQCGKNVKIGYSNNVRQRLSNLQTGMPENLDLLLVVDGNESYEKELHERFLEYHIRGEWFHYKGRLRAFIRRRLK